MAYHFIHIDNPCHLYIDTKRLMIKKQDGVPTPLMPDDCAVIILNHYQITLTQSALIACAKAGALLIVADEKHLPIATQIPMQINFQGAKNPWLQAKYIKTDIAKTWWRFIIIQKIQAQAQLLLDIKSDHSSRLLRLAKTVTNENAYQHEAQAAMIYWQEFFKILNANTKREKQHAEHPINQHLNYGYAIIRSLIARALAGTGLCLNFGVGHIRKDNPFNLVEDIMEPYRPLIDKIVLNMYQKNYQDALTPESKAELVRNILELTVTLSDKNHRLISGIEVTVNSYVRALTNPKLKLSFPDS